MVIIATQRGRFCVLDKVFYPIDSIGWNFCSLRSVYLILATLGKMGSFKHVYGSPCCTRNVYLIADSLRYFELNT